MPSKRKSPELLRPSVGGVHDKMVEGGNQNGIDGRWRAVGRSAAWWSLAVAGIVLGQAVLYGPSLAGRKILLPLDYLGQPGVYRPQAPEAETIPLHNFVLSDLVLQDEPNQDVRRFGSARRPLAVVDALSIRRQPLCRLSQVFAATDSGPLRRLAGGSCMVAIAAGGVRRPWGLCVLPWRPARGTVARRAGGVVLAADGLLCLLAGV